MLKCTHKNNLKDWIKIRVQNFIGQQREISFFDENKFNLNSSGSMTYHQLYIDSNKRVHVLREKPAD